MRTIQHTSYSGLVVLLLLGHVAWGQTPVSSVTLNGGTVIQPADLYEPTLKIRRGPPGFSVPSIASGIDVKWLTHDDFPTGIYTTNGFSIVGLVHPLSATTDSKWQAAELAIYIDDGVTTTFTRNTATLILRNHYRGDAPGSMAFMYGMHMLVGPERGSGNAGDLYGSYVQVGLHGSASGHVAKVIQYPILDCIKDNPLALLDACYGIVIEPMTRGNIANVGLYVKPGGTTVLDGTVWMDFQTLPTPRQLQIGAPDSCGPGKRCVMVEN